METVGSDGGWRTKKCFENYFGKNQKNIFVKLKRGEGRGKNQHTCFRVLSRTKRTPFLIHTRESLCCNLWYIKCVYTVLVEDMMKKLTQQKAGRLRKGKVSWLWDHPEMLRLVLLSVSSSPEGFSHFAVHLKNNLILAVQDLDLIKRKQELIYHIEKVTSEVTTQSDGTIITLRDGWQFVTYLCYYIFTTNMFVKRGHYLMIRRCEYLSTAQTLHVFFHWLVFN